MEKRILYFLLLILFVACQEELSPENDDFRGHWDSSKYAIQIAKNGYGLCNRKNWGKCEGNVKIKGSRMIFTSNNEDDELPWVRFKINQRPTLDSTGVMYMILDGHRFEKQ